jgi:hypothetical protein
VCVCVCVMENGQKRAEGKRKEGRGKEGKLFVCLCANVRAKTQTGQKRIARSEREDMDSAQG